MHGLVLKLLSYYQSRKAVKSYCEAFIHFGFSEKALTIFLTTGLRYYNDKTDDVPNGGEKGNEERMNNE